MGTVLESLKRLSPAFFVVIVICFFLPFTTFTCSGSEMTLSGINYVTGTEANYSATEEFSNMLQTEKVEPEPYIIGAFVLAILGVFLSFMNVKKGALFNLLAGFIGVLLLALFQLEIDNKIDKIDLKGLGIITVDYNIGFWLAMILFIVILFSNLDYLRTKSKLNGDNGL